VRDVVHVSAAARRNGADGLDVRQGHGPFQQGGQHYREELAGPELEDLAEAEERAVPGYVVLKGGRKEGRNDGRRLKMSCVKD